MTMPSKQKFVLFGNLCLALILVACGPPQTHAGSEGDIGEVESVQELEIQDLPVAAETFDELWPTTFTRKELTDTALAKTFDYFNSSLASDPKTVTVVIQDTVDTRYHQPILEVSEAMLSRFAPIAQPEHFVFAGTSMSWLMENTSSRGLPLPENGNGIDQPKIAFEDWGPGAFPEGYASGWGHKNFAWLGVSSSWSETEAGYVAGHELFHSLHLSIDGGNQFEVYEDGDPRNRPRWLIEGGANFFSYAVLDHLGARDYKSPKLPAGMWGLEEFESWWSSDVAYDYGQKAIEYLVANVGVANVLGIYEKMGEGKLFEVAFEEAIGIPVSQFYDVFDRHVAGV